jgi:hypothetical protein
MAAGACTDPEQGKDAPAADDSAPDPRVDRSKAREVVAGKDRVDTRPPPMAQPVPLWQDGKRKKKVDAASASLSGYLVVDLGEEWTPYIFTTRGSDSEEPIPNAYRDTYLALARGEFPKDHHGARAREDKYLELYGIMPTLSVLRERFKKVAALDCRKELDLTDLESYDGFVAYRGHKKARWKVRHHDYLKRMLRKVQNEQGVDSIAAIDGEAIRDWRDKRRLNEYRDLHAELLAIRAAQDRLECEGYFDGKGKWTRGAMDWATHEALAEFERRHRVYGWGYIGKETLEALKESPMELERRAVVRVLTERAIHAAGVIEDGSMSELFNGDPRTFTGRDGKEHPIPDLETRLRESIVEAFGLETPESALAWLEGLGDLPGDEERLVALPGIELPEYYDGDMELSVIINRGDVWYEFPYDDEGNERSQPVTRRPKLTVFTKYLDQRIPLARFGTTIGGWRSELVDGTVMWKYKNSPVGQRVWSQIVAAPVWLPPASTPSRDLLKRNPNETGRDRYGVNYHETGPSYASAYGLVAAYHRKFRRTADGFDVAGDEGIRTHGSVDYMSIMRRHSHGCHRLHNHLAVRLMSFVLAHRPHQRVGQQDVSYTLALEHDEHEYTLNIDEGGYVFELERPLVVNVLEGRVRGVVKEPITAAIPKYDEDIGAYMLSDGGAVAVNRYGKMTPTEVPVPDAGVDGQVALVEGETPEAGLSGDSEESGGPADDSPKGPLRPAPTAPPPAPRPTTGAGIAP